MQILLRSGILSKHDVIPAVFPGEEVRDK